MLRKGNTDGYFYIGDVFAAPMELVWDSDIKHEALVPFDEKMTIDTYVERATNLSAMRADAINKFISDKLTDYCSKTTEEKGPRLKVPSFAALYSPLETRHLVSL